jgi:hypothetical protein
MFHSWCLLQQEHFSISLQKACKVLPIHMFHALWPQVKYTCNWWCSAANTTGIHAWD